jgi:uncharacterized tellurite resistance protein B-like protein
MVMEISEDDRRSFVALLCRIAWADGVVTESEREAVRSVALKMGAGESMGEGEFTSWLDYGPPETEIESLPESLSQYFYYEAFKLAEIDGDLAGEEVELLESIVNRVFSGHDEGTPLARIALAKRSAKAE